MPNSNRFVSGALALLLGLGILAGMWQSLAVVFHLWGADSDVADPVLFWQGMHRYGMRFPAMWRYTQDNWLLSVMPVDFLIFSMFGDRPVVVVATGLLAFWAMVGLTGVLIGRERGALAGGGAAMVLLFAGEPTLGNDGFLGYAVSHGVSIVWGLLALYFCTLWLDRRRPGWLIGAGLCLFVTAISDPWADAAFVGPIAMAAIGLAVMALPGERSGAGWIALMAIVVGVLARTRLLGILGFLPGSYEHLASLSQLAANALFAARYVAVFLNIVPGSLERSAVIPPLAAVVVDCAVLAAIVLLCVMRLRRRFGAIPPRRLFIALTALISIGALGAALVLTGFEQGMVTARYLSNLFVFLPILLAACPLGMGHNPWFDRGVVVVLGVLFVVSGILSDQDAWRAKLPSTNLRGIPQMAAFLQAHRLRFGYGPYWWTEANAMNWVTAGRVTLRPVVYNPIVHRFVPKPAQSLALWYRKAEVAHAPRREAFVLSPVPGACGVAQTCLAAAEAQFGTPAGIVHYQALTVLIYDHHLYLEPP